MATKRNYRRTSRTQPDSKIKQIFKWLQAEEQIEHFKYIINRLFYLLVVLCMGFLIQWVWNTTAGEWFGIEYHINMFEAAILWVCVY